MFARVQDFIVRFRFATVAVSVFVLLLCGFLFGSIWYIYAILLGSVRLIQESVRRILIRNFALDYLAIATIATALITGEYAAGALIALMVCISDALEQYGTTKAEKTLSGLVGQIPTTCTVFDASETKRTVSIHDIAPGDHILVKTQEMIPVDGILVSERAVVSESYLTGESIPVTYKQHYAIKSGVINTGSAIIIEATGTFSSSTYQRIIALAQDSKKFPPRFVALARSFNVSFTIFTFVLVGIAWFLFHDSARILAILAIATPCPLIIAAPLSFLGGINRAAGRGIVVKRPNIFETIRHVDTVFFDKTGTLTIGEPTLTSIIPISPLFREDELLTYAAALEHYSLHPLAKTIINVHEKRRLPSLRAQSVQEVIGEGISGIIEGKTFVLKKSSRHLASGIALDFLRGTTLIGQFIFEDILKDDVAELFDFFKNRGIAVALLTGDTAAHADAVFAGFDIPIYSNCLPDTKLDIVSSFQKQGHTVALVGDGLNDSPALAVADVGIVFSGSSNTAVLESADVVVFSRAVTEISALFHISFSSVHVARQSVIGGIGLSALGILFAFFGFVSPVSGALIQEAIDIVVILNCLRSSY